jgi:hypothetical protein
LHQRLGKKKFANGHMQCSLGSFLAALSTVSIVTVNTRVNHTNNWLALALAL